MSENTKTPEELAAEERAEAEKKATAATAALSKKVDHLKGCPAQRPESYEVNDRDGKPVRMVRCIDCGQAKAL